jgi:hypothetical protein
MQSPPGLLTNQKWRSPNTFSFEPPKAIGAIGYFKLASAAASNFCFR